jgi:hypothetical protein
MPETRNSKFKAWAAAPIRSATATRPGMTAWGGSSTSGLEELYLLRWVFSFPAMLGAFLVGAVFYFGRAFKIEADLWWHLKVGQTILATHHWPTTDSYSFTTAGQPWIASEWLGEVIAAAFSRIYGLRGLDLLLILLSSAVILALYLLATINSNAKAGFAATALLAPLAFASFSLRPQMLGYLFLIVTMIVLELFRRGRKRAVWILPLLLLVWVNTHGSWIIGLGAIFVQWVCGFAEFRIGGALDREGTGTTFFCLPLEPYWPNDDAVRH